MEDRPKEAELLQQMLENAGYRVVGNAHSIDQALILHQQRLDLVLLELELGGKPTGIDLAYQ